MEPSFELVNSIYILLKLVLNKKQSRFFFFFFSINSDFKVHIIIFRAGILQLEGGSQPLFSNFNQPSLVIILLDHLVICSLFLPSLI